MVYLKYSMGPRESMPAVAPYFQVDSNAATHILHLIHRKLSKIVKYSDKYAHR